MAKASLSFFIATSGSDRDEVISSRYAESEPSLSVCFNKLSRMELTEYSSILPYGYSNSYIRESKMGFVFTLPTARPCEYLFLLKIVGKTGTESCPGTTNFAPI